MLVQDDRPLSLMALSLGAEGEGGRRAPVGPLHFRFRLAARVFDCRFEEVGTTAVLTVACPLGRLPPERTASQRHANALRVLDAAQQAGVRIRQRHGGVVVFSDKRYPPAPVPAGRLIADLTRAVLPAMPWIALLQDTLDPSPY
jgi:hypothetical protein